jgi:hypothetical protein
VSQIQPCRAKLMNGQARVLGVQCRRHLSGASTGPSIWQTLMRPGEQLFQTVSGLQMDASISF